MNWGDDEPGVCWADLAAGLAAVVMAAGGTWLVLGWLDRFGWRVLP